MTRKITASAKNAFSKTSKLERRFGKETDVDPNKILKQWLSAFAWEVPEEQMSGHVLRECCYLWHIFSYGDVPCLCGDEARIAFDAMHYSEAFFFKEGYTYKGSTSLSGLCLMDKHTAKELEQISDAYMTAPDFSWTYIRPHESYLGPYFCLRRKRPFENY